MIINTDLTELLVDEIAEIFEQLSNMEEAVQWFETKRHTTGANILMPKFQLNSWKMINEILFGMFDQFTEKHGTGIINGINSSAIPETMTQWEAERLLTQTEPQMRRGFYYDRPTEYGKEYAALHSVCFASLYPSVLMQMLASGHIDSSNGFWGTYGNVVQYRVILKQKLSKRAYGVLKLYINYGMLYQAKTDDMIGMSWYNLVIDYSRYLMSALCCEIGIDKVIYADTDEIMAEVSNREMQAAASRLKCGIPYCIEYIPELTVTVFKKYSMKKISGEVKQRGPVKQQYSPRSTPGADKVNILHTL